MALVATLEGLSFAAFARTVLPGLHQHRIGCVAAVALGSVAYVQHYRWRHLCYNPDSHCRCASTTSAASRRCPSAPSPASSTTGAENTTQCLQIRRPALLRSWPCVTGPPELPTCFSHTRLRVGALHSACFPSVKTP